MRPSQLTYQFYQKIYLSFGLIQLLFKLKYLITGLGNIGDKYENTRHNIGFDILDALAKECSAEFEPGRHADTCTVKFKGRQFVLIKPTTFVNLSGKAVNFWLQKEKIPLENLLVTLDDLALPFGTIRLRAKGNNGGHNGLANIDQALGTNNYARLRFGIGSDYPRGMQVDFVLEKWTIEESSTLDKLIESSANIIKSFGTMGVDRTMSSFNNK